LTFTLDAEVTLDTDRLILRHSRVGDAAVYRQLWTERDLRVPAHRRISSKGRPTVEDIAAQIRAERGNPGPGPTLYQSMPRRWGRSLGSPTTPTGMPLTFRRWAR
jgi:hypothetical protein